MPSACACTPGRSKGRWPGAGSNPKAADLSAHESRKEDDRSLPLLTSPGRSAADPGARPDAGQVCAAGTGLVARYEQLRHAALHARAEAFPLGLAELTPTPPAWTPTPAPPPPASAPASAPEPALPAALTRELVNILAALTLAPT
jgi:hypothetical protein